MAKAKLAINALIMDKRKTGIGNYAFHLLQELNRLSHGLEMDVYIQRQMQEYFPSNGTMHFVPCPDFKSSRERILYEQFQLLYKYRRNNYTVVHFLDYLSPLLPMKARKVVTIHDLSYFVFPDFFTTGSRLIKQLLTGPSIRSAARVICVSNNTKNDIARLFNMKDKLRVTYLGVEQDCSDRDAESEQKILSKYGIVNSYIMHTGTLEPRKNTAALIRAFSAAVRKGNLPHYLVLCGKPGWKYEWIFQEIKNSGLEDRIIITGYVPDEDLSVLLHHADVFVYPSLYEGFGLPPLEAMAHGAPVICSSVSSLPEVVGDAALMFHPRDEEKLADLIIRTVKDPELRQELSRKGYQQAARFTWRKTAEETLKIYRELIQECRLD